MMGFSGLIGNRADHLFCTQAKAVWRSFSDRRDPPRNGDLEQAIRRSQLLALRLGVRAYKHLPHPNSRTSPGYSAEDITTPLMLWIDRALITGESWPDDQAQRRAVEDRIEQAFVHPVPHGGTAAQRQQEFRDIAETWTLSEARKLAPEAPDWDRFDTLMRAGGDTGVGHFPGWWPVFRAFLAEEVKRDEKVQRILAEQGIAQLLNLHLDLKETVVGLQVGLESLVAPLRDALDDLREATHDIANTADRIEAALARIDRDFEQILPTLARIEAGLQHLPEQTRALIDSDSRSWHGIAQDIGQADLPTERVRDRPTELLIARYRVVPFLDRGGLLSALRDWVTKGSGRQAQGRLYVAPGGFGKTRLGIELLADLPRGWHGTFLSQMNGETLAPGALPDLLHAAGAAGICIVVDYAESPAQIERLRALANAAATATPGPPIRLVAFARSAEGWWDLFAGERGPGAVFDPTPFAALHAPLSADDRTSLYTRSRQMFVARLRGLGLPYRDQDAPPDLAGADRPLVIAATAFLDASGIDRAGQSVFQTLYEEERRHWRRILAVTADDEVEDLARAAAQVTLVQGATEAGVKALIQADPNERTIPAPKLLIALRRLYGRRVGASGESVLIGAIEPDLLGEHAALSVLERDGNALLGATLGAALSGPPFFAQDPSLLLTVLTRATRPEHDHRIRRAANAAIAQIAGMIERLPNDQVERLENALPIKSVALRELSAIVARRLVDLAIRDMTEEARAVRAARLNDLGVRLSDLDRRDEALAAIKEAVKLLRTLVARNRGVFLPDLAIVLNNLSSAFSDLSRWDEALATIKEAVKLNRELFAQNQDFMPILAGAINNLGNRFSDIGLWDDSLAASEEATKLYRELVNQNRDTFLSGLANAVNNLGNMLSKIGRREEAMTASEEATKLYRELVNQDRDAFLPNLAVALSNIGNRFSDIGRWDHSLAASEEAVNLHRELVAQNRDAFLPDLAMALNNLGNSLSNLDRLDEAIAASEEAVKLQRELVAQNRDAFLPDLATTLNSLGNSYSALGRRDAALAASEEAVKLRRELVAQNRDAFLSELAKALGTRGITLLAAKRAIDAAEAFLEGARLLRPLVQTMPAAFGGLFEALIRGLIQALRAAGRVEDIPPALTELGISIPSEPEDGAPAP